MNDEIRKSRSSNHDYYQYMLKLLGEELLPDFKVSLHKYLLIMMKKQLYNRKSRQTHLDKMIDINYEMHAIAIKYKGKNTGLLLWHPAKIQNLILIMRIQWTNPDWETFYKIMCKSLRSWKWRKYWGTVLDWNRQERLDDWVQYVTPNRILLLWKTLLR